MNYVFSLAINIAFYCVLCASLNIILGYGGMFHMGHGGFYAIGAYSAAIIAVNLGLPFFLELIIAGLASAVFGIVIGFPSIRLKGDYIAFCTFAFGMVIFNLAGNWMSVTNGPNGIVGIERPVIFNISFSSVGMYFILTTVVTVASIWIMRRIIAAPYGKTIEALREDEIAAASCGKNVSRIRVEVFCVGAFFAGIAGCLFAHYMRIVDPTSFQTTTSFLAVSMVIVGGMASFFGPIVGAVLITIIPEILKFIGLPGFYAAQLQYIIYSLILLVIIIKRPQGLVGKLKF